MNYHLNYLRASGSTMLTAGAFICSFIFFALAGCAHQPPRPTAYSGPTEPIEEVVDQINANNSRLPTLWARIGGVGLDITYVDEKGKSQNLVLGGALLYRAPGDVKLVGHHDLAGDVMVIGSNADVYWFNDLHTGQAWWGRYKYLGDPRAQPIAIRPDLLLSVLGVSTINVDLLQEPVPVMRFNNQADAYMMIWSTHLPNTNHWVAVKEVWYDRATKQPTHVVLFDINGRVLVDAHLFQHKAVKVPDLPPEKWPMVATAYDVTMPEAKARMHLRLSDLALSEHGAPNDVTFRFNPQSAGVPKVTQLDEACGP